MTHQELLWSLKKKKKKTKKKKKKKKRKKKINGSFIFAETIRTCCC